MPKVFGKELPPVVIGGMAVLTIVVVYTAMIPADEKPIQSRIKKATRKTSTIKGSIFTEQDYDIKLASAREPLKNSFRPLVVRQVSHSGGAGGAGPTSLPGTFTGDGGQWVYTGMAEVNGVSQALLENRKTGDAEFVQKGQRWKQSTILSIEEDSISFSGPAGELFTMVIGSDSELPSAAGVTAPSGVGPVTVPPSLMGTIGGDLGVQPMPGTSERPRRGGGGRRNRGNAQGNQEE